MTDRSGYQRPSDHTPSWDELEMDSPRAVVHQVAMEGANRLLFERAWADVDRATDSLVSVVGQETANALNTFIVDLVVEAVGFGSDLGAALVEAGWHHPSFEAWLQAAIVRAGLADYTPSTRWETPS